MLLPMVRFVVVCCSLCWMMASSAQEPDSTGAKPESIPSLTQQRAADSAAASTATEGIVESAATDSEASDGVKMVPGGQGSSAEQPVGEILDPENLPEEYKQELQSLIDSFRGKRLELEKAIGDQREIYIRYLNREEYSPERREAFYKMRDRVRELLDETFMAAVDVLRLGFDEEAGTYVATLVQHRHNTDIYNFETLEGALLLINGGSELKYVYETAARSAVACGEFDIAKSIYERMLDDNQDDIDSRLEYNLEEYREEFMTEFAIREAEIKEDRLPRVLLNTTQGDIVVELFLDQAPSTVTNFINLVEEGFYDGLDFFQVIDHLLALTGDPGGTGEGNSGRFLVDEHTRPDHRKSLRGSLVMAKIPAPGGQPGVFIPNSASSQFAISLLPILAASQEQTVFGTVIEGMDVVSRMRRVDPFKEKKKGEVQYPSDSIIQATVIRRPEVLPEPKYFQY